MNSFIIASSNAGKLKERQALLSPIQCIAHTELGIQSIKENQPGFIENALLKQHLQAL